MATVRIDRTTYTEFSDQIVQIVASGFQCVAFSCEQIKLEYVNSAGQIFLIAHVTGAFLGGGTAYNWRPTSLSPGVYKIRAFGLDSRILAETAPGEGLTVVPVIGGGVEGELLEAYIVPASPAVNSNFTARALVHNKGTAAGQFFFNAVYLDTANNYVNSKRSTTSTIQPGASQLLSAPAMLATVAGKVIIELRTSANETQDLREVNILPSGGTNSAFAVINSATVPAIVNHDVTFGVALTLGETNGISGSARIVPVLNGVSLTPAPPFTIAGGVTNLRKDITFKLTGPANFTIGFKVETFINGAWIVTDTEAAKPVQVLAPVGPPVPPPPPVLPPPPPPPTGIPNIPIEYLIVVGGVIIVAVAMLLPTGKKTAMIVR